MTEDEVQQSGKSEIQRPDLPRLRRGDLLLVRRLKSVDWCSARLPRRGDFLPMIE